MRMRTTSTQQTYRYVRISLLAILVFLGVAILAQVVSGRSLGSISATFYTPARDVFVGALCAVTLALLTLGGRSLEQSLLDIAALFAPIIAFVPAPAVGGDLAGTPFSCPGADPCIPNSLLPSITNSMFALGVVAVLGLVATFVIAVIERNLDTGTIGQFVVATVVIVVMGGWWVLSPATFLGAAHYVAAVSFFLLLCAAAVVAAWRPLRDASERSAGFRVAYSAVAAGILASLGLIVVDSLISGSGPTPAFFAGQVGALAFFAAFWVVQTVEFWDDPDPQLHAS